jgi:hypothetical protein
MEGGRVKALLPAAGLEDLVALVLEIDPAEQEDVRFVVDHEDPQEPSLLPSIYRTDVPQTVPPAGGIPG